jgi:circadian clock protein KaiB
MTPEPMDFKFVLYIVGTAPKSLQAISNLNALCCQYLAKRHHIEIVDVFRNPKRALADAILLTPTLVRTDPHPVLRVVGTLNDLPPLLQILGLAV